MKKWFRNKHAASALAALASGQLLYFFGFKALFVLSLVYFLAVALPYPAVFRSLFSRLVAGFLIAMSLLQVVAALQFILFPSSGFKTISLLTFAACVIIALIRGRDAPAKFPPFFARQDFSALVMVAFFAVPVGLLFFKSLDPVRILSFTGIQSPDAVSHYNGISSMGVSQHLDYRTTTYYPRGFHIASAFTMDGLHVAPKDLNWQGNERVFAGLYVIWGAVLGYVLYLFSYQVLQDIFTKARRYSGLLLSLVLGPIVALLYLIPFVYLGFVNYYYICAAVLLGLLFMYEYSRGKIADWPLVLYLTLVFGVSMSWGPLLAPALFLIPLLYVFQGRPVTQLFALAKGKRFLALILLYVIELIPIYLHIKYARLTDSQGINAAGIITDFHYGIDIIGLVVLGYLLFRGEVYRLGNTLINSLIAFYFLVGAMVLIQYFSAGELRYYSIKTSYLLEMIILAFGAAAYLRLFFDRLHSLRTWITLPLGFGLGVLLLLGMTGSPLLFVRQTFRHYSHFPNPQYYDSDVAAFARLGRENKIIDANDAVLHYDISNHKLFGDGLVQSSADSLQYGGYSKDIKDCHWMIYQVLVYGSGTAEEQNQLITALHQCIVAARARHHPYYVVTDPQSVVHLLPLLGTYVTFVY